jgi:hypothetical protein
VVVRIEVLEIDDHILDKIETKHGVEFSEVEDAGFSDARHIRKTRDNLYNAFSRTSAGRYLLIVLVNQGWGLENRYGQGNDRERKTPLFNTNRRKMKWRAMIIQKIESKMVMRGMMPTRLYR